MFQTYLIDSPRDDKCDLKMLQHLVSILNIMDVLIINLQIEIKDSHHDYVVYVVLDFEWIYC